MNGERIKKDCTVVGVNKLCKWETAFIAIIYLTDGYPRGNRHIFMNAN
jgi:formylmethanofuran dehydrogenase subunit B